MGSRRIAWVLPLVVIGSLGSFAAAETPRAAPVRVAVAAPAPLSVPVVPPALATVIERDRARIWLTTTTEQRTKLAKASRAVASELDARGEAIDPKTLARKYAANVEGMAIEDAIMLMFMLIAEDARKDMREMLAEMEATRRRREALREGEAAMKEAIEEMRAAMKKQEELLATRIRARIELHRRAVIALAASRNVLLDASAPPP
jgi:hypothetical protein